MGCRCRGTIGRGESGYLSVQPLEVLWEPPSAQGSAQGGSISVVLPLCSFEVLALSF